MVHPASFGTITSSTGIPTQGSTEGSSVLGLGVRVPRSQATLSPASRMPSTQCTGTVLGLYPPAPPAQG